MSLREAAEKAIRALRRATYIGRPEVSADCESAIDALHAALAEPDEPVAWYFERERKVVISFTPDRDPDKTWQPLYAHPPRREPLTEEEVRRLYREAWTPESEADEVLAFARAIERAHGIGGDE